MPGTCQRLTGGDCQFRLDNPAGSHLYYLHN